MAPSAIVVAHTSSDMQPLMIVGIASLGCAAFIGMVYGEILLLHKV
jgi:hypothetical protein